MVTESVEFAAGTLAPAAAPAAGAPAAAAPAVGPELQRLASSMQEQMQELARSVQELKLVSAGSCSLRC